MHPRLAQLRFAARVAPRLLDRRQRLLWQDMRRFCRALSTALEGPLPEALKELSVKPADDPLPQWANEKMVRQLADLAILVEHETGLGICLRRSLTRYHYLHRLGLPLVVHFGARLDGPRRQRNVSGHAWLTLDGVPYHEPSENYRGFAVMYTWPEPVKATG